MTAPQIVFDMETRILLDMIRLLSNGAIGSAEWQAKKLAQLGTLRTITAKTITENLGAAIAAAQEEIRARAIEAAKRVDDGMTADKLADALPPDADPVLRRTYEIWEKESADKLATIRATMLTKSQEMYTAAVYRATAAQLAGQITAREAIAETATEWARTGIPALVDKAGRHWTPEAYAATVIRANSNNVARETQDARFDQFGHDLVQVSSHTGSRPEHAPFQGRIYSRSGKNPDYDALSVTGYGTVEGIGGINCSHFLYAYREGDKKTYHPMPLLVNEKDYNQSQQQRAIERSIRAAKRELSLLDPVGDAAKTERAKERVANRQKAMRDFIEETGRTRQRAKEQIYQ